MSLCKSCDIDIVISQRLDAKVLEFEISGKTYRSDWLIFDNNYETVWSQISGEAVIEKKLEQASSQIMTYAEFSRSIQTEH